MICAKICKTQAPLKIAPINTDVWYPRAQTAWVLNCLVSDDRKNCDCSKPQNLLLLYWKTPNKTKRRMGKNSSAKWILRRIPVAGSNNYYPMGNCTWRTLGRMINGNNSAGGSVRTWDQFWAIRDFENDIIKMMSSIQFQVSFVTLRMITSKMRLAKGYQKWIAANYDVCFSALWQFSGLVCYLLQVCVRVNTWNFILLGLCKNYKPRKKLG